MWLKLDANKRRDRLINRTLRRAGWTVVRVWEHELRQDNRLETEDRIQKVLERIRQTLGRVSAVVHE